MQTSSNNGLESIDIDIMQFFKKHHRVLMQESSTFIAHIVWGTREKGELSISENELHGEIYPIIIRCYILFGIENMDDNQQFLIQSFIKRYISIRLNHMTEVLKFKYINYRSESNAESCTQLFSSTMYCWN